ncbi:hypothetical protein LPJ56_005280 [Coemansia sp. RSA 2599]|nr:hypothetical protein LPJ75_005216 [Coemansia sp. RSA 2598]KAJ1813092.1 hypothetical protein LPJ56_005280 [Coemansia sp. RSA 2599]
MLFSQISSNVARYVVLSKPQCLLSARGAFLLRRRAHRYVPPMSTQVRLASSVGSADIEKLKAEAQAIMEQGNTQKAYEQYNTVLQLQQTASNHYNVGVCAQMLGKVDEAIDRWNQALALEPGMAEAHANLGAAYFVKKRDLAKGLSHMEEALRFAPEDAEVKFNLGAMYDSVGELEKAKTLLEDCVRCSVENAEVLLRNVNAKIAASRLKK